MPTFAELKGRVAQALLDPNNAAISDADVGQAVNDALRYWRYRRFWFNSAKVDLTLVAGNPVVPNVPADLLFEMAKFGLVVKYNQLSYPLRKVLPHEYDAQNNEAQGLPEIYTWRNGQFELFWYPNQAYTLTLNYVKDYAPLVNAADNNDFTNQADSLLIYEAASRLYGTLRQDRQKADDYLRDAMREYDNLCIKTGKQTGSGSLAVDTII